MPNPKPDQWYPEDLWCIEGPFKAHTRGVPPNAGSSHTPFSRQIIEDTLGAQSTNHAFYQIFDHRQGDIVWQYRMDETFGIGPNEALFKAHLDHIHPDFLQFYLFWVKLITELEDLEQQRIAMSDLCYHLRVPFRHADGRYHWFFQHSMPLLGSCEGHNRSYFSYFEYGGLFSGYNPSTQTPYFTNRNFFNLQANSVLYRAAGVLLKDLLTPSETNAVRWHLTNDLARGKMPWSKETLHEYNANVLRKLRPYVRIHFQSARDACLYLKEINIWSDGF